MKEITVKNKTQKIAQYLRKQIEKGKYKQGEKISSAVTLASQFGVNKDTVNAALLQLVAKGLVYRSQGSGTFVKNREIGYKGKSKNIAFVTVRFAPDGIRNEIVEGIEEALDSKGYNLLLRLPRSSIKKERAILESLNKGNIAGVILCTVENIRNPIGIRNFLNKDIPIVLIDRYIPGLEIDYVVADDRSGVYSAVKYLIDLGHKKIAHITAKANVTTYRNRLKGYQDALIDSNIKVDNNLIKHGNGENIGYELTNQLFEENVDFTALSAVTDNVAIGAIKAIKERNLYVPDDISVVGFGDLPQVLPIEVPLTTVIYPKHEIGTKAAEILVDKIEGKSKGIQHIVLDTKLVVRKSSKKKVR